MMMVEDMKKDINNSLKEIPENTAKQVEDIKEEAQKSLKELQENITKQVEVLKEKQENTSQHVMEMNKTTLDRTEGPGIWREN